MRLSYYLAAGRRKSQAGERERGGRAPRGGVSSASSHRRAIGIVDRYASGRDARDPLFHERIPTMADNVVSILNDLIETSERRRARLQYGGRRYEELRVADDVSPARPGHAPRAPSDLQQLVGRLGGKPEEHGSVAWRGASRLGQSEGGRRRSRLTSPFSKNASVAKTSPKARYTKALEAALPQDVRLVVEHQFHGVNAQSRPDPRPARPVSREASADAVLEALRQAAVLPERLRGSRRDPARPLPGRRRAHLCPPAVRADRAPRHLVGDRHPGRRRTRARAGRRSRAPRRRAHRVGAIAYA